MSIAAVFLTAVGLAMDAFAVSLSVGASPRGRSPRAIFRIAFHTGLFQGLMTLLGWLVGSSISHWIDQWDHWVVVILLAWVGFRMIREGMGPGDPCNQPDMTRGGMLVMMCVATSIDAMAVGLTLAMLNVHVLSASLLIGVVTLSLSTLGCLIGGGLGSRFGKRMEVVGGLILNVIGLRVLISGLFPTLFL